MWQKEKNVKLVTSTYNCNYCESKSQIGGREREREKKKKRLTAFFSVHFDFPAVVNQICVQC